MNDISHFRYWQCGTYVAGRGRVVHLQLTAPQLLDLVDQLFVDHRLTDLNRSTTQTIQTVSDSELVQLCTTEDLSHTLYC